MCAPLSWNQSHQVIALSATEQLGMAATGQIQLTAVMHPSGLNPLPDCNSQGSAGMGAG